MVKKIPLALRGIRIAYSLVNTLFPNLADRWAVQLFLTPRRSPYTKKGLALMDKVETFDFMANGKPMVGYKMGTGPEVICLHGWAGKATQFADIADTLAKSGHTFVSADVYAHGNSQGKKASMFDFAAAVVELQKMCSNPRAIIGHSLGAAAISFAVSEGMPIQRFVALGAPTLPDDILDSFRNIIKAPPRINQVIKDACLEIYKRDFDSISMSHTLKSMECPVLAIHGYEDFDVGIFHLDEIERLIPNATTIRVEGLGHRRILKDKGIIHKIIAFIEDAQ